jgi:hypothetical protein
MQRLAARPTPEELLALLDREAPAALGESAALTSEGRCPGSA